MARGRGFPRVRGGAKRRTDWIGPADQGFVSVASAGATLLSNVQFSTSSTIVRVRGHIAIRPAVYSADVDIIGAYGIGIVSAEAFTVGITAVPEPFSDGDWGGWFVYETFSMRVEFRSDTGVLAGDQSTLSIPIDSKAMRKVESNEALVVVAESQAGAYAISSQIRILNLLS